jgi:hypothetical protein
LVHYVSVALLDMNRLGCWRCGSVLRGRGVGYCNWCRDNTIIAVTESPGPLWLMSQGLVPVPCVDWRIFFSGDSIGSVAAPVPSMSSGSGVDVLCIPDSLVDMHVSPMSTDSDVDVLYVLDNFEMRVSPISSDSDVMTLDVLRRASDIYVELSRVRVTRALAVLLHDQSLAGIFSYCDDYCRLSLTNRYLYGHGVFVALYRYWNENLWEAGLDAYIQERADSESSSDVDVLCQSCGLRSADEVLASVECWQCYDEHTD